MLQDWLQRFYQDTVNVYTMWESNFSWITAHRMWAFCLLCYGSLKALLFMHVKSGVFKGFFYLKERSKERIGYGTENRCDYGK